MISINERVLFAEKYLLEHLTQLSFFRCSMANLLKQEGIGKPFGYMKAASSGQSVNLFVMPYNYPCPQAAP